MMNDSNRERDQGGGSSLRWGALALALTLSAGANALADDKPEQPEQGVNIVVQVVDDLWLPLREATVTVATLAPRPETYRSRTDDDGYAQFAVPPNAHYAARVTLKGFKEEKVRSFRAWANQKVYIQLKLRE
jgi:Carboxypeptidase regulatory-like domain